MRKLKEFEKGEVTILITTVVILLLMAMTSIFVPCLESNSDKANRIIESTVLITDGQGHGSGVYLGDGVVLTARHCLGIANAVIVDSQGNIYTILEEIQCGDLTEDIGFIRINPKATIPAMKRFGKMPRVTERAYICGTPLEIFLFGNFTTGTISNVGVDFPGWWDNTLIADTAAYPGNSGGGIYNENFELVGILVGGFIGYDNLSIIEPIEDILDMIELEL